MKDFFSIDGWFFRFMSKVADVLILNLVFVITSIPIITMGASYTALYYYFLKLAANEEGYLFKSFFKSFKVNFKQGLALELIFAVAAYIMYIDVSFLYQKGIVESAIAFRILFYVVIGVCILLVITFLYAFPLLSRFENTVFGTLKNAAFMSIKHLSTTVPLALIGALCLLVGYILSPMSIFFIVGAWVAISSSLLYKVIDHYIPKENPERYVEDYYMGAEPQSDEVVNLDTINSAKNAMTDENTDTDEATADSDNVGADDGNEDNDR